MDIRGGALPPEQHFQMAGSWIPGTPARPVVARWQATAANGEGNHAVGANWVDSTVPGGVCSSRAYQESACQNGSCETAAAINEGLDLNMGSSDQCWPYTGVPTHVGSSSLMSPPQVRAPVRSSTRVCNEIGYSDLVRLMAAGDADIRTSLPASLAGSVRRDQEQSCSPFLLNGSVIIREELFNGAQSFSAVSESVGPSFAPVTPDKQKGTQGGRHVEGAHSVGSGVAVREGQEPASILLAFNPEGKDQPQLHLDQGVLEQTNFSLAGLPLQQQESVEKQGVDLNKTPQQKPRRKKHRPKVVREGKPARTPKPVTPKQARPGESTPGKRKYVRRKGINTPLDTNPSVLGETVNQGEERRSVRRHLDFSDEVGKATSPATTNVIQFQAEAIPELNISGSTGNCTANAAKSTFELNQGQTVDLNSAGIALALSHTHNQILNGYLNPLEIPSLPLQPSRRELIRENLKKLARIRDSGRVPSHENTISDIQTGYQRTPENLSTTANTANFLSRDETVGRNGWKMEINFPTYDVRLHKDNSFRTDFDYKQSCKYNLVNRVSGNLSVKNNQFPCFPETHKKRRTQKVQNGLPFNGVTSFADAQRIFECEVLQAMEGKQAFGQSEVKTTKSSKVHSQSWNMTCLADNTKCGQLHTAPQNPQLHDERQENGIIHEPPQACIAPLVADIHSKVNRKTRTKRGKKQSFSMSTAPHNINNVCGSMVPHVQADEAHNPLDVIVNKMKCLNINRHQEGYKIQEQFAIVPYGAHGMIVPFVSQHDLTRKSRPRAKVDLDQETNRVWKLLMGKENSDGIEGTDIDKEKWWEEERRVFRGRADSFIARMHLVQGDRRFSPWKGSVLDSVIGVFLTQNVSDHLSSSAFMSLAARFPCQSKDTSDDKVNTLVEQQTVCNIDLNDVTEKSSDLQAHDHVPKVAYEAKQMEEKEMHSAGSNPAVDVFPYSKVINTTLTGADDRRLLDDIHSSQNSVVSSQNSSDDLVLASDQIASIWESKCEAVDLLNAERCSSLETGTSFMELLEKAGASNIPELFAHSNGRNSETESFNTHSINIPKQGCPLAESLAFSSIAPIDIRTSGSRDCILAESATNISNREKSTLTSLSVSSGDSHAFMCNLGAQTIYTGYGRHSYGDEVVSWVMTDPLANSSFHNYSALQEERTMEIHRKEVGSDFYAGNIQIGSEALSVTQNTVAQQIHLGSAYLQETSDVVDCFTMVGKGKDVAVKAVKENSKDEVCSSSKDPMGEARSAQTTSRRKSEKVKSQTFDWESLRRQTCQNGTRKSSDTMDSLDWEAVRNADVSEISSTIRERGMNNMLAERIKSFLDRLMKDHGSVDLEWLRDVPPDKAKDYLLSIRGLGLKSVECVRLLTLHHLAFPVDTNVGRICVRLGWVPLQPLPESLQLHLLELYPMLETIQKYLWPRLCTLDQRTLYELHYQMITFGKVFCTKSKPNCNACPMRGECKHFASAFASARLALPGPEEKSLVTATMEQNRKTVTDPTPLLQLEGNSFLQQVHVGSNCEPIVEEPATPESECTQIPDIPDIEDAFCEDPDEIPTIKLNAKEFAQNLQNYMQENNMELQTVDWSKALVALTPEAASIPMPKLKNVSRLRTEHQVYELPDSHSLLEGLDQREPQDPCPYLLAIWTPGETAQSIEPPESCSSAQGTGNLCDKMTCFACNSIREAQAQTVRGTLLIPCRTAMRGSFPLNGTYFQVNEVFADHETSLTPIDVPRAIIWNLPRRTVYFGTSIPTIFRGLAIEDIQNCFWRGFVCVRGFDRRARGPRPLMARLHFPASKVTRGKKPAARDDEYTIRKPGSRTSNQDASVQKRAANCTTDVCSLHL